VTGGTFFRPPTFLVEDVVAVAVISDSPLGFFGLGVTVTPPPLGLPVCPFVIFRKTLNQSIGTYSVIFRFFPPRNVFGRTSVRLRSRFLRMSSNSTADSSSISSISCSV
jgi:hypothetical protein